MESEGRELKAYGVAVLLKVKLSAVRLCSDGGNLAIHL